MIRVRFAPSPTGSLHVGGARTALFNWLLVHAARRRGEAAAFVLRVEDTDKERSTDAYTRVILDGLAWLGLTPDEGPFFQAEGLARHQADATRLLDEGKAYVDDGAIRFRVSHEEVTWDDLIHGPITFHGRDLDDFVILRADRTPVYNFAVVSDDVAMRITHVLRGDDHISNTPKQILLYRALGHAAPAFGHVPMILGTDKKKLSKRHGATAVADYQHQGILPQAMVNFLALLGWSPGGDRELFFSLEELVDAFSLAGIQKKPAVFDPEKLVWMNSEHMRHLGPANLVAFIKTALPAQLNEYGLDALDDSRLTQLASAVLPRSRTTLDLLRQASTRAGQTEVRWDAMDEKARTAIARNPEGYQRAITLASSALEELSDWEPGALESRLRSLADEHNLKAGEIMQPVRIAVTGSTVSEPVNELLAVVGKDLTLTRLKAAGSLRPPSEGGVVPRST